MSCSGLCVFMHSFLNPYRSLGVMICSVIDSIASTTSEECAVSFTFPLFIFITVIILIVLF